MCNCSKTNEYTGGDIIEECCKPGVRILKEKQNETRRRIIMIKKEILFNKDKTFFRTRTQVYNS